MLYTGAINTGRSSFTRRIRLSIIVFFLLCTFYWFTTNSAPARPGPTKLDDSSATKNSANPNWRVGANSNERSRRIEAVQAAIPAPGPTATRGAVKKDLIVASTTGDNTTWLYDSLPDWHKSIYIVDDKHADLTVSVNKGRESMVYLTYVPCLNVLVWLLIFVDTLLTITTNCRITCSLYTLNAINGTTMIRTMTACP